MVVTGDAAEWFEDPAVGSRGAALVPMMRVRVGASRLRSPSPYIQATRTRLPDGDGRIVFDRFHIMREMTKAVDTVRKQEHRAFLRTDGDSPLTKTKYLWLFSEEHLPERHADTFAAVQTLELKVGRAWAIKEALRTLWTCRQGAAVTSCANTAIAFWTPTTRGSPGSIGA